MCPVPRPPCKPAVRVLAAVALSSCGTASRLTGVCEAESVAVQWPVTVSRGGTQVSEAWSDAVYASNIERTAFDALERRLIQGQGPGGGVAWGVPAFGGNGTYVSVAHPAPLDAGATVAIEPGGEGGGWGAGPGDGTARVSARTQNGVATLRGLLTVRQRAPFRALIEVEGTEGNGQPLRIAGEATFSLRRERRPCD